jgi:tetratricopeptide (TPR) repeat protein
VHQSQPNLSRMLSRARRAHEEGALGKAERLYAAVLEHDPRQVDALHLAGMVDYQRGRLDAAVASLRAALQVDHRRVDAFCDLGLVLYATGRMAEALASYDAALRLRPDDPAALNGRGVALLQLGRCAEALVSFERATALDPGDLDALGNRGNALLRLNRPDEAIASYDAGLRIAPGHARLLTNRAVALRRFDRPHEALLGLSRALVSAPNFAEARFVESLIKLTLGDFRSGWQGYESRWGTGAFAPHRRSFAAPLWLGGRPLAGKTILLHAEQGYGDAIQFARYAPLVAGLGASVVLEARPALARLLSPMRGVDTFVAHGQSLPAFDLHCPLMSLPLALGTELATIPAAVPPYLSAPQQDVAAWRERLPAGRPRVGLVWAGDRLHNNDLNRSIHLELLRPLVDLPQFQFVGLQQETCAEDARWLRHWPRLFQAGPFRDFAETAAVIAQLDAVIAVDTAVAHLAGAMGKPLLLLLPFAADFRWLRERQDNPWYPTARLIRQHQFNDWGKAIDLLCRELVGMGRRWSDDGAHWNPQPAGRAGASH